jgi:hypothetical protein
MPTLNSGTSAATLPAAGTYTPGQPIPILSGSGAALAGGVGATNQQIIGGTSYTKYTPEWYQAMEDFNTKASGAAGTAAGTYTANAASASGLLNPSGSTTPSTSTPASITGLDTGGTGGTSTGTGTTSDSTSGGSGAAIPQVQMPDMQAANQQAFARAKDTAGNLSRASLDALNGELGSQGMLGSGAQAEGAAQIIAKNANTLGDEANTEASTNAGLANTDALANQSAAVTGRGQDIQQQEAAATLAQQKTLAQQNLLQQILGSLAGSKLATPAGQATAGLY